MISLNIEPKELKKLEASLSKIAIIAKQAGKEGLHKTAEDIMAASYIEVPKGTYNLANSQFIDTPEETFLGVNITFGYGGPNDKKHPITGKPASSYMIPVHERLHAKHLNGEAKFLEDPVNRIAGAGLGTILANKLKEAFARFFGG